MKTIPVVVLTVTAFVTAALAFDTSELGQGGSVYLDELKPLLEKAPKLRAEVDAALSKISKKPEAIRCSAMRFPAQWDFLGGGRVAPYTCQIGARTLRIDAQVRITDQNGKAIETINRYAMKNGRIVTETNLTWKWQGEGTPGKPKKKK